MTEDELKQRFAANLRGILRAKNMTQRAFAKQVGIGDIQVSRWTTAKSPPGWDALAQICTTLKVSPAELFKEHRQANVLEDELFRRFKFFHNAFTSVS